MDLHFVLLLGLGAMAGGFINGLAGFGTALLTLGIWLQIMPPQQAVAIIVIVAAISGIQGVWIVREDLKANPKRLMIFLLPAILGVPLGIELLSSIDAGVLKIGVAAFLLLYGSFFIVRRNLPSFERPTPVIDAAIGFLSGVLGGAASLSGALPTMWCAMRPWTKQETRAVLQPFNVVILLLTAVFLAWRGAYTRETLLILTVALPITMVAAQIGIFVFHRLTDVQFRRLLIALMFLSGILLSLRELL
ncbi:sulfite exporter TauE/SafE family protein [Pseudorhodobacter turbinis]|uniref:Probable membrane transporter protein n=1 Tax=Pseudorhodobacter turbinis TaxID=2500533 RepID=A0A4P8EH37_9RHOB|nr:sulfite exporter TauE/SafE family protein [Pseudorhodobacter turbinis]QCO56063.1 sulfite exporter TauE/SafE family protein [Pseudorhodobacter turbinis]